MPPGVTGSRPVATTPSCRRHPSRGLRRRAGQPGTCAGAHLAYSAAFALAALAGGMLLFTRIERTFMDTV